MRDRRSIVDRTLDRDVALVLSLLVVSRCGNPAEVDGYLMTLVQRAVQGAKWGDS